MKLEDGRLRDDSPLRLRLRVMDVAPDKFPDRIRASTIASYWWCGWKSYATAILGLKMPEKEWMSLGTSLHDKLFDILGKRFPWERDFIKEIDKYREDELGFVRQLETGTDVYVDLTGHPDDFQVTLDREISIIEYKTTRMPEYLARRFIAPVAAFQAKIYPFVLEPTVHDLGYSMYHKHAAAIYSSKDLSLMLWRQVPYAPKTVQEKIDEIFYLYEHPEKIKPCVKWKCKYCSKVYKAECPFAPPPTK